MTDEAFCLSLQFHGARLNPPSDNPKSTVQSRIGWFWRKKVDIGAASVRYRCFPYARVLSDRFESDRLSYVEVY